MASSYTGLGTELMVTGEQAGTWGSNTNTNLQIIEQIAGGYVVQTLNAAGAGANTTTLAVSDGATGATLANRVIILGAVSAQAITGNKIVTIPLDVETFYIIKNSTSGAYTVQFKYVSGSGNSVTWSTTEKGYKILYAAADDATNPNIIDTGFGVGTVTLTGTETLSNKTLTAPKFADAGFIADTTGAETLVFGEVSSPLNEFKITNAATGNGPILSSQGQTNVPINITPAGTGDVFINPPSTGSLVVNGNSTQAGKLKLYNDTDAGTYFASFQPGTLTEDTAYVLPTADAGTSGDALTSNASGTLSWSTISGGVSWQAVVTGATQTAVAGRGYFINTTSNACTLTLPASPSLGDEVNVIDYAGTFDSNNLTVAPAGSDKIHASTDDLTVATERAGFALVFTDGTQGWLLKDK